MTLENIPFLTMMSYFCSFDFFPQSIRKLDRHITVFSLLFTYIQKYEKVFIGRLDLRFPSSNDLQKKFSDYKQRQTLVQYALQHLRTKLIDKYNCDPQYFCSIEKSSKSQFEHEHYHIFLLLNGNKIKHMNTSYKILSKIWNRQLNIGENKNYGLVQKSKASKNNSKYMPLMVKKFDEAWHNPIDFDKNLNNELIEIFKENQKTQGDKYYDGILLNKNSSSFLFDLYVALYTATYLVKDRQKENVIQRKKINTSQLKSDKDKKEIRKFINDLLAFCLKKGKENFYETYRTDSFFKEILLLGANFDKQKTSLSKLPDNTIECYEDAEGIDNPFEDNPFETEIKEFQTTDFNMASQDVCIKANHENAHYSKQEEIYNEDEINEETMVSYLHKIENYKKSLIKDNEEYLKDPEEEEENDEYPEIIPCEDCCV